MICIPGSSGSAECYFRQVYGLGTQGYRVITVSFYSILFCCSFFKKRKKIDFFLNQVEYPEYWSHTAWCDGFTKFLDQLNVDKVTFLSFSFFFFFFRR